MTRVAHVLRLDQGTWRWLDSDASISGAGFVVIGAYLLLAFDRFGWPDFAIRATTRTLLIGFYGWMWLAVGSSVAGRLLTGARTPLADSVRLTGHAHLPILLVAVFLTIFPVTLGVTSLGLWPLALFAGVFWMPAMLVNAVATASGSSIRRAAVPASVAYLVWALVVGRWLVRQVGHLL